VQDLLFSLADWQALAKLGLHLDTTLSDLDKATEVLGANVRKFASTVSSSLQVLELPSEATKRVRKADRKAAAVKKVGADGTSSADATKPATRKVKEFNMTTYKLHALGDYVETIARLGTTDSYSTQIVSVAIYERRHNALNTWPCRGNLTIARRKDSTRSPTSETLPIKSQIVRRLRRT
jgi:hypothetical protein